MDFSISAFETSNTSFYVVESYYETNDVSIFTEQEWEYLLSVDKYLKQIQQNLSDFEYSEIKKLEFDVYLFYYCPYCNFSSLNNLAYNFMESRASIYEFVFEKIKSNFLTIDRLRNWIDENKESIIKINY
jgi:hypothetical protein